jgi:hypothetical protein
VLRAGTRTLFVLVPGILGYGWEWDPVVAALRSAPAVDFVVYWWEPQRSLARAADDLARVLERVLVGAPASVTEVRVIGHSAGGIVAAWALGRVDVPPGRHLHLATVGSPLAGMMGAPSTLDDPIHSPMTMAMIGTFRHYPDPPPGSDVVEYVTQWPSDPVMEPRYGHQPADPAVGPRGARRVVLPKTADHNRVLSQVIAWELQQSAAGSGQAR